MHFYQCIDVNKNQLIYQKTNKLKIKTLFTFETISYCILTSTYYCICLSPALFVFDKNVPDFYGKKQLN